MIRIRRIVTMVFLLTMVLGQQSALWAQESATPVPNPMETEAPATPTEAPQVPETPTVDVATPAPTTESTAKPGKSLVQPAAAGDPIPVNVGDVSMAYAPDAYGYYYLDFSFAYASAGTFTDRVFTFYFDPTQFRTYDSVWTVPEGTFDLDSDAGTLTFTSNGAPVVAGQVQGARHSAGPIYACPLTDVTFPPTVTVNFSASNGYSTSQNLDWHDCVASQPAEDIVQVIDVRFDYIGMTLDTLFEFGGVFPQPGTTFTVSYPPGVMTLGETPIELSATNWELEEKFVVATAQANNATGLITITFVDEMAYGDYWGVGSLWLITPATLLLAECDATQGAYVADQTEWQYVASPGGVFDDGNFPVVCNAEPMSKVGTFVTADDGTTRIHWEVDSGDIIGSG